MNEIMKFEGNQVEIIVINEQPHFEVYSTGMALGQSKEVKGRSYPRKERIDENLKNAEISTVVHNGQRYINESQLYDLMLEIKTSKCRAFRKWVTKDVLPSIRKTGTYSIHKPEQLKLSETTYEYIPKFYKGQLVVTYNDLEHFTKINKAKIRYHVSKSREIFEYGVDLWYLEGKELAKFKRENKFNNAVNHLTIITKTGFEKLVGLIADSPKEIECFEKNKESRFPCGEYLKNEHFDRARRLLDSIEVLLHTMTEWDSDTMTEHLYQSATTMATSLNMEIIMAAADVRDKIA